MRLFPSGNAIQGWNQARCKSLSNQLFCRYFNDGSKGWCKSAIGGNGIDSGRQLVHSFKHQVRL